MLICIITIDFNTTVCCCNLNCYSKCFLLVKDAQGMQTEPSCGFIINQFVHKKRNILTMFLMDTFQNHPKVQIPFSQRALSAVGPFCLINVFNWNRSSDMVSVTNLNMVTHYVSGCCCFCEPKPQLYLSIIHGSLSSVSNSQERHFLYVVLTKPTDVSLQNTAH